MSKGDGGREQSPVAPDITAILGALTRHGVAFVVIGGLAVAHHGYIRATKDVDIVPEPTGDNLERLWVALLELEARPIEIGDFRVEELPVPFTLENLLRLGNWALLTNGGRLDLLQHLQGKLETLEDYAALESQADRSRLPFGTVLFASYDDLIDFKNIAGRDQDLTDIRALREARGETDRFDDDAAG